MLQETQETNAGTLCSIQQSPDHRGWGLRQGPSQTKATARWSLLTLTGNSGHSFQPHGAHGTIKKRRGKGVGLPGAGQWSPESPGMARSHPLRPPLGPCQPSAIWNSHYIPFNLSRGSASARQRKRPLGLVTVPHLCLLGPGWPINGVRAENDCGPPPHHRGAWDQHTKQGGEWWASEWGLGGGMLSRSPSDRCRAASIHMSHLTTAQVALQRSWSLSRVSSRDYSPLPTKWTCSSWLSQ